MPGYFIHLLRVFTYAVSTSFYIASCDGLLIKMNWKGYGRKRSWPNTSYYTGICLDGLGKITKGLHQIADLLAKIWSQELRKWSKSSSSSALTFVVNAKMVHLNYERLFFTLVHISPFMFALLFLFEVIGLSYLSIIWSHWYLINIRQSRMVSRKEFGRRRSCSVCRQTYYSELAGRNSGKPQKASLIMFS
jgi:hypothetical protein